MCLISLYPPGVMPDEQHLTNGTQLNPDGFGFSMQQPAGWLSTRHDLYGPRLLGAFMLQRLRYPDGWAVFHSRYATGGSPVTVHNCQPVELDDGSVLVHNGALFPTEGTQSDTRVFARDHLPHWDLAADLGDLENRLGRNKMVVLPPAGEPTVLNRHLGVTLDDGTWHSNCDYTGTSHIAAERCSACGKAVPGLPAARLCATCQGAYENRRSILVP
jgi:hypothetical protein